MTPLGRRLGRVAAAAAARRARGAPAVPVTPLLLVSPDAWPPHDEAAYHLAEGAGDRAAMDALVERHTGHRPAPPGSGQVVVRIREVPIRPHSTSRPGDSR